MYEGGGFVEEEESLEAHMGAGKDQGEAMGTGTSNTLATPGDEGTGTSNTLATPGEASPRPKVH